MGRDVPGFAISLYVSWHDLLLVDCQLGLDSTTTGKCVRPTAA